ncbi:MAG TPA: DUF6279 family lipoprotein [Caldimonas sp.]|nr:DUF6279 family lipoprotein [Caldimonas sp.]HEX4234989.1 DUF6279 family lipoprotein [Caldimonas sp.]
MTTTFNTMPTSALPRPAGRSSIIAALGVALVLALGGCSLVKLGYGQADAIAFRWLDGYVDFDDAQSWRARTALAEALAWHRRTQLPDYMQLLARAEAETAADTTPERMCAWAGEIRDRLDPILQFLAPAITDVALSLAPAQFTRIDERFAETNEEFRDEHLQKNTERRQRAMVRREADRAEMLYGKLDDAQRALIVESVRGSPYSAERVDAERKARQQEALAFLRHLRESNPGRDDALLQVRAFLRAVGQSPREAYRIYAERVASHNCALESALHNAASPTQRREAAKRLAGYRNDARALIGEGAD